MSEPIIEGAPTDQNLDELFGGADEPFNAENDEQAQATTPTPDSTQQAAATKPTPAPTPAAPAALSKDDFIQGIETAITKVNQQRVEQQQKPLTPAEIDKMLNVFVPKKDFFDRFNNVETREAAFLEMRDGLMTQAMTAARYMIDMQKQEFEPKLTQFEQFVQEQKTEALRRDFLETYPGLQKWSKLLPMISNQLQQSGYRATTKEDGFTRLADEAAKFIRENIDPEFDPKPAPVEGQPSVAQQQKQRSNGGAPAMALASAGRGQQGVAKTPSRSPDEGPDNGIWD
jgi:hypothetical protein